MSFLDRIKGWFENIVHHDDYATVTVIKGDSLWTIADQITGDGGNWTKIASLNPGLNKDYVIHPGDELKVPLDWVK